MVEPRKQPRAAAPAEAKPSWLEREIVGDFIFAPLARGAVWLFLHLLLAIKLAFIKIFLS
jgi:hypothetical protein